MDIVCGRIKELPLKFIAALELKFAVRPHWLMIGEGPKYKETEILTDPQEISIIQTFRRLSIENQVNIFEWMRNLDDNDEACGALVPA